MRRERTVCGSITSRAMLLALLLCGAQSLRAQAPATVYAGAGLGGAIGLESASIDVYAGEGECGVFESGLSTAGSVDGRLVLPAFFSASAGLDARLRVALASARLTASPPTPTTVRDDDGSLVTLEREFRLERSTIATSVDLLARMAAGRIVLSAGLALGARIGSTLEQSDIILGPGAQAFSDGQTTRSMSTSGEPTVFSVAPMLVAGYTIPSGGRTSLVPELSLRFDALSSVEGDSWRAIELGLGIAVLFDLTPLASPIVPGPDEE